MRTELLGASSAETLLSKFMLAWVLLETDYSAEVEELLSTVAAARQSNAEGNVRDVAYAYAGLALLMIHKGQTESALENFQKAMQLLQQSNDESLEVFALAVQGMIQAQMGDTQGAVDQFHQALQLAFEVVGETHPAVVQLEVELAKFLIQLGDLDAAEATYRSALKRAEQSIGRQPRLAETLFELGDVKRDQGMIDEAEDFYRQALDIQIQYLGDDHPHVAYSTAALAAIAYFRGDIDEAKQMFQTARSILQSRLGDDTYQQLYPLCGLAVIAHGQDDGQEADRLFDEARRIGDRAVAGENLSRRLQFVANDVAGFGSELVDHDNPVPAERVLRLALTLRRAAISDTDWRIAQVENDLGACLVAAAQYEVAEPMLLRSQKILKTKFGNDHKYSQTALDKLVELYDAWGKSEKADKFRSQREQ